LGSLFVERLAFLFLPAYILCIRDIGPHQFGIAGGFNF